MLFHPESGHPSDSLGNGHPIAYRLVSWYFLPIWDRLLFLVFLNSKYFGVRKARCQLPADFVSHHMAFIWDKPALLQRLEACSWCTWLQTGLQAWRCPIEVQIHTYISQLTILHVARHRESKSSHVWFSMLHKNRAQHSWANIDRIQTVQLHNDTKPASNFFSYLGKFTCNIFAFSCCIFAHSFR